MRARKLKIMSTATRRNFEQRKIDKKILKELYLVYNPIENVDRFIERAETLFPKLNCGLASVYLKNVLGFGDVVNGSYENQKHTFLLADKKIVVDITSDQFGGPKVYVGPLKEPWSL